MAITSNGKPRGPIFFTDAASGARVFIGTTTPTNPSPNDVWIDSDPYNNAGKNKISEVALSGSSLLVTVPSSYKDVCLVLKGVAVSANADLTLKANADTDVIHTISGIKTGVSTNILFFTIQETQAATFAHSRAEGVYTNSSNTVTPVLSAGVYPKATAISSLTVALSTGTFSGGTAIVYGVN